jgi:hypothetical protein
LITNNKDDLYKDVLKMLFAFVGGFGGGIGYKTLKDKE